MNIFNLVLLQPLANGLIVFYRLLGQNMGLAIIGFSLFLRFILNPLTKPYMESMKKMRELAPQLEKIKKKHKGDKMKIAQAQAEFYKQKGISPGSGCLPYILQIVVLIAFFNVFTKILSPGADTVAEFNKLLYDSLKIAEGTTLNLKFLYLDITQPDKINIPGLFSIPGPLLILSAIAQLVSAKIMQPYESLEEKIAKKTPGSSDDFQVAMQKSMVYTFPFFTLIIGLKFPSGLALYWLVFSISQAYQQYRSQGLGGLKSWVDRLKLIKI